MNSSFHERIALLSNLIGSLSLLDHVIFEAFLTKGKKKRNEKEKSIRSIRRELLDPSDSRDADELNRPFPPQLQRHS